MPVYINKEELKNKETKEVVGRPILQGIKKLQAFGPREGPSSTLLLNLRCDLLRCGGFVVENASISFLPELPRD